MPKIFDNIENNLITGLNDTIDVSQRVDFCVGYFNLRGWNQVTERIDKLPGAAVFEGKDEIHRVCRLLVGMQKLPVDQLWDHYSKSDDFLMDQSERKK